MPGHPSRQSPQAWSTTIPSSSTAVAHLIKTSEDGLWIILVCLLLTWVHLGRENFIFYCSYQSFGTCAEVFFLIFFWLFLEKYGMYLTRVARCLSLWVCRSCRWCSRRWTERHREDLGRQLSCTGLERHVAFKEIPLRLKMPLERIRHSHLY